MTQEELTRIVDLRCIKIKNILANKAREYASDDDRLHNFKRGAAIFRCTPEKHNLFLNSKHLISIQDMVNDLDRFKLANAAQWEEKIGDAINYLVLLEALIIERLHESFDKEIQNAPSDG